MSSISGLDDHTGSVADLFPFLDHPLSPLEQNSAFPAYVDIPLVSGAAAQEGDVNEPRTLVHNMTGGRFGTCHLPIASLPMLMHPQRTRMTNRKNTCFVERWLPSADQPRSPLLIDIDWKHSKTQYLDPFSPLKFHSKTAEKMSLQTLITRTLDHFLRRETFHWQSTCLCEPSHLGPVLWFSASGPCFDKLPTVTSIASLRSPATVALRRCLSSWIKRSLTAGRPLEVQGEYSTEAERQALVEFKQQTTFSYKSSFTVLYPNVYLTYPQKIAFLRMLRATTCPQLPSNFYDANTAALQSWRLWGNDKFMKLEFIDTTSQTRSATHLPAQRPLCLVYLAPNSACDLSMSSIDPNQVLPLLTLNRSPKDMGVVIRTFRTQCNIDNVSHIRSNDVSLWNDYAVALEREMWCQDSELQNHFSRTVRESILGLKCGVRSKRRRNGSLVTSSLAAQVDSNLQRKMVALVDRTLQNLNPALPEAAQSCLPVLIWQRTHGPVYDTLTTIFPSHTVWCPIARRVHCGNRLRLQVLFDINLPSEIGRSFLRCFDSDCVGKFVECGIFNKN